MEKKEVPNGTLPVKVMEQKDTPEPRCPHFLLVFHDRENNWKVTVHHSGHGKGDKPTLQYWGSTKLDSTPFLSVGITPLGQTKLDFIGFMNLCKRHSEAHTVVGPFSCKLWCEGMLKDLQIAPTISLLDLKHPSLFIVGTNADQFSTVSPFPPDETTAKRPRTSND